MRPLLLILGLPLLGSHGGPAPAIRPPHLSVTAIRSGRAPRDTSVLEFTIETHSEVKSSHPGIFGRFAQSIQYREPGGDVTETDGLHVWPVNDPDGTVNSYLRFLPSSASSPLMRPANT